MRDTFQHRRDVLVLQLARMCDLAGAAMRRATTALLDNDLALAERVIANDGTVNEIRSRTEHEAQILLALQAPVATDLRTIMSVTHGAASAESMGALAHDVALAVRRHHAEPAVPVTLLPRFERMGQIAVRMAAATAHLVRDPHSATASDVQAADAEMDELHCSVFTAVGIPTWPHGVTAAVNAVLLSGYYERFADCAVTIAHRSIRAHTGGVVVV